VTGTVVTGTVVTGTVSDLNSLPLKSPHYPGSKSHDPSEGLITWGGTKEENDHISYPDQHQGYAGALQVA